MNSTLCPGPEQLRAYVAGKLAEDLSLALDDHLDVCAECQALLVTLGDAEDTLETRLRRAPAAEQYEQEPACREAAMRAKALVPAASPAANHPPDAPGDATSSWRSPAGADAPLASLGRLGEYELLAKLGEGGMGTVYKARQTRLDKIVALKVLPKERTSDAQARARFEREMKAVGRVSHPNIIQAHDARDIDGTTVLVMEYAEGLDLAEVVRRLGRLGVADACEIVHQAALGLEAVHENGLVHRDIKPSNLMLTAGLTAGPPEKSRTAADLRMAAIGQVKILDLGLARLGAEQPSSGELTSEGQAMGTADYMAPEQAFDSHTVDIRADIYSLGCTLYKLLAGHAPFSGPEYGNAMQKMLAHREKPVPPLGQARADVPKGLLKVLDRMLAKKPEDRFATPAEVAAAIAPFAAGADLPQLLKRAERSPGAADKADSPLVYTEPHASSGAVGTDPKAPLSRQERVGRVGQARASERRPTISAGLWWAGGRHGGLVPPYLRERIGVKGTIAVALGLCAVILFGVLLTLSNRSGTLVVESDNPNVEVAVKLNGELVEVVDAKSGWKISLKSGVYDVAPQGSSDQFQLDKDTVTVRRGDVVKVKLTLKRPPPISNPQSQISSSKPEIPNPQSEISNPKSEISSSKSQISNPRSPIPNPQSPTPSPLDAFWTPGPAENVLPGLVARPAKLPGIARWQLARSKRLAVIRSKSLAVSPAFSQLARSADGQWLASISEGSPDVRLWTSDGRPRMVLRGHAARVTAIVWSPTGKLLASAAEDGTVRLWQPEGGPVLVLKTHTPKNTSLAWSPDGKRLVSGGEGGAELWSLADLRKSKLLAIAPSPHAPLPEGEGSKLLPALAGRIEQIVWRPDGKQFAARTWDDEKKTGPLLVWDAEGGAAACPKISATGIAWSADGKSLLACSCDTAIRRWHGGADEPLPAWEIVGEQFVHADYSPDGKWLSSDSEDGSVRLWRAGEQPQTIRKSAPEGLCRSWSPDSRWLAVPLPDHAIQLWDLAGGKAGPLFRGHTGTVTGLCWEGDGRRLVSCAADGTLRRWDVSSGEPLSSAVLLPEDRAAFLTAGGRMELSACGAGCGAGVSPAPAAGTAAPQAQAAGTAAPQEDALSYLVEQPGGGRKGYAPAEFRLLAQSLGWAEKAGFAATLAADAEWLKAEEEKRKAEKLLDEDPRWTPWRDLFDGKTLDGWRTPKSGAFVNGKAEVKDHCIALQAESDGAGIAATQPVPAVGYEVTADATRSGGRGDFCTLVFPIAGQQCVLYVGGAEEGNAFALGYVDGSRFADDELTRRVDYERGRYYRIRLRVMPDTVRAWLDGEEMLDLATEGRRLEVGTYVPELVPFGVYAWNAQALIRSIRIRELKTSSIAPHPNHLPEGEGTLAHQARLPDGTKEPQKLLGLLEPGQWVSLFDGKTLAGWAPAEKKDDPSAPKARVEEGRIVFSPGSTLAWTGPLPKVDYELALELDSGANSALGLSTPIEQRQVGAHFSDLGDGLWFEGSHRNPIVAHRGRYYHIELRVTKGRSRLWVDGRLAGDLPPADAAEPKLAFGSNDNGVAIRNIRLRKITAKEAVAPPAYPHPRQYVPGKPLSPPKVQSYEICPEGFDLRPGGGLSWTALAAAPAPLAASLVVPPLGGIPPEGGTTNANAPAYAWSVETAGHRGGVAALAFSPDGRLLASAGDDACVRIWDAARCRLLRMFSGLGAGIVSIAWSPDGKYLAAADERGWKDGGGVRIFDARSGRPLRRIAGATAPTRSLAWSADGGWLACGGDRGVYVYDVASANQAAGWPPKRLSSAENTALSWSLDGRLAANTRDEVWTWSPTSGEKNFVCAHDRPYHLAWSPDARAIATVTGDYSFFFVRLKDSQTGEFFGGFGCLGSIAHPFWSPDGRKMLVPGSPLVAWDIATGDLAFLTGRSRGPSSMTCSPDMRQVAVGNLDGSIALWQCDRLEKGALSNSRVIPGQSGRAEPAGFSPDATRLVVRYPGLDGPFLSGRLYSVDFDQCLDEWGEELWGGGDWAGDGACFSYADDEGLVFRSTKQTIRIPGIRRNSAAWSHDGKTLAAWCGWDKTVQLVERSTQKVVRKIADVQFPGLAWSPDDKTLAVACGPKSRVKLIPIQGGKETDRTLDEPGSDQPKGSLAWSPDGKTLAGINYVGSLIAWDVASGKLRPSFGSALNWQVTPCWLDEGKSLAAWGEQGVTVWEVAAGKLLRSFSTGGESCVAFAPHKGLFAVAGPGAIRLRSLADGRVIRTVAYLSNKRQVSVSPEGHWRGSPGVESDLRCLVLTDAGQEMLTVEEFEKQYGWKNDPAKALP